jgi:hypothetical protein
MPFGVLLVAYHTTAADGPKDTPVHGTPLSVLPPQNLLDLTDLFLHFAGYLFGFAFGLQLGTIGDFPGDLLDLTLHFVKRSFRLVPNARFHGIPPLGFRFDCWYVVAVNSVIKVLSELSLPTDQYSV